MADLLKKRHVVHPETGYGLGWKKDPLDARDHFFSADYETIKTLPRKAELSTMYEIPPYDQGQLGSCTANAIGALMEYDQKKQGIQTSVPSRLFIYYFERYVEGTTDQDAGAVIRDGVKVANKMGAPPEDQYWPYDISRFAERPPDAAVSEAANHQALRYQRVMQTPTQIRSAIFKGFPVVFGFTVYSNFFDIKSDGIMPMPGGSVEGGHAVAITGYDDDSGYFTVRNSWGTGFGDAGYFYAPYAYITDPNLSSDFWIITKMEGS